MLKKVRSLVFVATLLLTIMATRRIQSSVALVEAAPTNKKDTSDNTSLFGSLKAQYDELSPRGKVVTGAAVGFVGSRLALGTVTKVVKWGAGAFIVYVSCEFNIVGVFIHNAAAWSDNFLFYLLVYLVPKH
jgi:hypothetical protein